MSDSVVVGLQVQLSQLQRLVAAQASEIDALREEVRRFAAGDSATVGPRSAPDVATGSGPGPGPKVSRRAFARLAAMTGVGAAAATVGGLSTDTAPAAAAVGRDVLLGKDNKGATGRTGIFAHGGAPYVTLADPNVDTGSGSFAAGAVGTGPIGLLGAGLGVAGAAVYATDSALNASPAQGTGECSGVKVALTGPLNGNPAISAEHAGLGYALLVNSTSASNIAAAVAVSYSGFGPGILVTDGGGETAFLVPEDVAPRPLGTGPGVVAQLRNPNNLSPAIEAHTSGPGPALEASATSGAAVSASSLTGPAGHFASHTAHLRLTPGPAGHPAEGETGDLFVDAAGDLWFCKGPGTWVKLA